MTATVLIEDSPSETRAALVVDGRVQKIWLPEDAQIGAVYIGLVRKIDRNLQAAFVDIGQARDGFLSLRERPALTEGATVTVQIKRTAVSAKGALLTTNITPGALQRASIEQDKAPKRLDEENSSAVDAFLSFQKDDPRQILVAGTESFLALQAYLKNHTTGADCIVEQDQSGQMFECEGVEEAIEQALSRTIDLPDGGRFIIDEAEALTAIDIDIAATQGQSKRGSIIRACSAAIPEIIRQLGLRRIGGQVVIDFPALAVKGGGQVQSQLKQHIKSIPGGRLGRIDDSGIATLILPRRNSTLLDLMTEHHGSGPVPGRRLTARVIAGKALRLAEAALKQNLSANIELRAIPDVIDLIISEPTWMAGVTVRYGPRLTLTAWDKVERDAINVREIN